jgi:hypothetical protein
VRLFECFGEQNLFGRSVVVDHRVFILPRRVVVDCPQHTQHWMMEGTTILTVECTTPTNVLPSSQHYTTTQHNNTALTSQFFFIMASVLFSDCFTDGEVDMGIFLARQRWVHQSNHNKADCSIHVVVGLLYRRLG